MDTNVYTILGYTGDIYIYIYIERERLYQFQQLDMILSLLGSLLGEFLASWETKNLCRCHWLTFPAGMTQKVSWLLQFKTLFHPLVL